MPLSTQEFPAFLKLDFKNTLFFCTNFPFLLLEIIQYMREKKYVKDQCKGKRILLVYGTAALSRVNVTLLVYIFQTDFHPGLIWASFSEGPK